MKKMMMALAALCVAGAASAVTFDWDYAEKIVSGAANNGADVPTAITQTWAQSTSSSSIVYGVEATLGQADGEGNRIVWGLYAGDQTTVTNGIWLTANKGSGLALFYGSADPFGDASNQIGSDYTVAWGSSYDFSIEVTREGTALTVSVYAGDSDAAIISGTVENFGDQTLDMMAIYGFPGDTAHRYGAGTNIAGYVPLPEPTALALLALGVAGLALRRKAA